MNLHRCVFTPLLLFFFFFLFFFPFLFLGCKRIPTSAGCNTGTTILLCMIALMISVASDNFPLHDVPLPLAINRNFRGKKKTKLKKKNKKKKKKVGTNYKKMEYPTLFFMENESGMEKKGRKQGKYAEMWGFYMAATFKINLLLLVTEQTILTEHW